MGRFLFSTVNLVWKTFPRHYCAAQAAKSNLSQLRKKTGIPLKNCRAALEKFDNNLEEAEKWLIEQAQKEGWAKADKLQSRPMSQGLVGVLQSRAGATMVEVNCETDFVARNEKFQELVYRLTTACHDNLQQDTNKKFLQHDAVNDLPYEDKKMSDAVALEVGTIGENMRLRRAIFLPKLEGQFLNSYVHNSDKKVVINDCHLGRFGTLLSVQHTSGTDSEESIETVTKGLCQHIIASSPLSIGNPVDKPSTNTQEETRLLFQEYALDEEVTVKEILDENDLTVTDFVRFECGELLPEEKD